MRRRGTVRRGHVPADAAFPRCRGTPAHSKRDSTSPQARRSVRGRTLQFPAEAATSEELAIAIHGLCERIGRAGPEQANNARAAVEAHLSVLSPEQDAAILRDAGFVDVSMFFAAFTWRGWVAYA